MICNVVVDHDRRGIDNVSVKDPDFTVVGHHLLTPIFQKEWIFLQY
jgi:hypothetical protein